MPFSFLQMFQSIRIINYNLCVYFSSVQIPNQHLLEDFQFLAVAMFVMASYSAAVTCRFLTSAPRAVRLEKHWTTVVLATRFVSSVFICQFWYTTVTFLSVMWCVLWQSELWTARVAVWYLTEDLIIVLHSSDHAAACYVTRRRGQGSLNRGVTLKPTEQILSWKADSSSAG